MSINKNFDGLSYYPINQYTTPDKWKEFESFEEMKKAIKIDSVSLSHLNTKQLMIVCLEYPLLLNYYCHNDKVAGVESICNSFVGFRILKTRKDYMSILSDYYFDFEKNIQNMSETGNRHFTSLLREAITILYYGEHGIPNSSFMYFPCNTHSVKTPYGKDIYHAHKIEASAKDINDANDYFY